MDLTFFLVPLAAVIAPLIAAVVGRALVVPIVVFEIALGMLIGPFGLDWIRDGAVLESYSQLGLAMLFFMAGNDFDLGSFRGDNTRRAFRGWGLSAVLALGVGFVVGSGPESAVIIAIALSGTALGIISPILRDSGLAGGRLGSAITASGALGEFLPLVAITVFLSGRSPIAGVMMLLVFVTAAAFAFYNSSRDERPWLQRLVTQTLHTSGQFAVRIVVFLLAGLVTLALVLGVDFMLGAFTAGLLARMVLRASPEAERAHIDSKLEAVSFGFFVPIFFVTTGITFPLDTLFADAGTLFLVPVFALAFLLVRGVPGYLMPDRAATRADRRVSALFSATTLSLVIAVTRIGLDAGVLDPGVAAALTGGAMLTVMVFPMLAVSTARRARGGRARDHDTRAGTAG